MDAGSSVVDEGNPTRGVGHDHALGELVQHGGAFCGERLGSRAGHAQFRLSLQAADGRAEQAGEGEQEVLVFPAEGARRLQCRPPARPRPSRRAAAPARSVARRRRARAVGRTTRSPRPRGRPRARRPRWSGGRGRAGKPCRSGGWSGRPHRPSSRRRRGPGGRRHRGGAAGLWRARRRDPQPREQPPRRGVCRDRDPHQARAVKEATRACRRAAPDVSAWEASWLSIGYMGQGVAGHLLARPQAIGCRSRYGRC